ncbi:MAG: hypothetical protein E2O54_01865 [Gammaproteobacteria bacterium]|nr:MAG: hypothetical protein E2O58_05305 [Gammaproteobacteria bacterium]TDJ42656.1 MAG: hypothetical protein E2O54_01865 [Gammaproteobacteria bacterium]
MPDPRFITQTIEGMDGMVRGYFMSRALGDPASADRFPGVRQVAILPKKFESIEAASEFIETNAEPGGNAVAVQFASNQWLVGAWVAD